MRWEHDMDRHPRRATSGTHWSDEGLPDWAVKVGDRVRQGVIPEAPPDGWRHEFPPEGTLGTVAWVQESHDARPEVWVRWDGVRYVDLQDSSMSTWIEPAAVG
jgi:hypothetical protein